MLPPGPKFVSEGEPNEDKKTHVNFDLSFQSFGGLSVKAQDKELGQAWAFYRARTVMYRP